MTAILQSIPSQMRIRDVKKKETRTVVLAGGRWSCGAYATCASFCSWGLCWSRAQARGGPLAAVRKGWRFAAFGCRL